MKKVLTILLVGMFIIGAMFMLAQVTSVSLEAFNPNPSTDGGAKDPHSHVGTSTLCYNLETLTCDGWANKKKEDHFGYRSLAS